MNMPRMPEREIDIAGRRIGHGQPAYFVADIAANHDGDLEKAKELIHLAAEAGADAAKFQHFRAETIVSDAGFRAIGKQASHQAAWEKSVFEVYKDASVDPGWTPILAETCRAAGIIFFTSPYAMDIVEHVDPYVPAYKIGSGDITWIEMIECIAARQKPYMLATGASSMGDVERAVDAALSINPQLVLMQCNTNYTAQVENFRYIQLRVLNCFREMYPDMILGLSDHTPHHATVLGAVALGAKVIEKHFTSDTGRTGPDHAFSMDPRGWREMVDRTRELEYALGSGTKHVEFNECETVVLQRRALRLKDTLASGTVIGREHLVPLRPCPTDAIPPYELPMVCGLRLRRAMSAGSHLTWTDLE